ncbi:hypothetical protein DLAC_06744 [Tieghemostelium lacteum]|uniref:BTB domain-containing protein n=1 Tax=Tieghemostelium lacteum TaxID=361077 RepID=A0A151ZFU7_TIELA|nr:hypothetical protein DLAC_06744 [Tieghemostelium lacteum]|eukprot:KYQ92740.1 hypothetical protein DLAC_06744 [Tieghemostelium lacteum]
MIEPSSIDQHLVWGWNNNGQLGTYGDEAISTPTALNRHKTFVTKSVSIGLSHSLSLSNKSKLYSAGKGQHGRLGRGTDGAVLKHFDSITLTSLPNPQIKIIKISCGGYHSAFISEKRDLYTFGRGDSGQLGHGQFSDQFTARKVDKIQFCDLVACGADHTVVSTNDGSVYVMGSNKHCQLGMELLEEKISLPTLNRQVNPPPEFMEFRYSNINAIACGQYYTVVIKNGLMYSWGLNNEGQCGFPKKQFDLIKTPRQIIVYPDQNSSKKNDFIFVQVSCGIEHTLALTNDGMVFGFGSSKYGQISQGMSNILDIDTSTPIRIGESLYNEFVTQISCGSYHCLALSENGNIYSWGLNDFGQCGNGSSSGSNLTIPYRIRLPAGSLSDNPISMIAAGGRSSMAIRHSPSVITIRKSNYSVDIMAIFTKANNNIETYSDCQVSFKDSKSSELKLIKSHRIILSRSSVFNSYGALEYDPCVISIESLDLSRFFNDNQREIYPLLLSMYNDNIYDTTNTISNHLFNYVNSERFSDVRIRVEFEGEIKIFNAHKCILVTRSQKFKTLFESQFSEAVNSELVIDSISPTVYYNFLHYLYTDRLNINDDNVIELYVLSHQELQERMKDLVESYLYSSIDDENVCSIYQVCCGLNVDAPSPLEDQCVYYIAKNLKTVQQTDAFNSLSPELKQRLSLHSSNSQKSNTSSERSKNCNIQ